MCCEAAAKLILSQKGRLQLILAEDDGTDEEIWEDDAEILEARDCMLRILQDRDIPVDERIERMLEFCETSIPDFSWECLNEMFASLERLDSRWDEYLALLLDDALHETLSGEKWEVAFEQLAVYFVYRHFSGAAEDGDIAGRAGFAALSVKVIRRICEGLTAVQGGFDIDGLADVARMYSSEIEYSDENIDAIRSLFDGM